MIDMEDDPAEQGVRGDKDLPPNVGRELPPHQSGGERGKLPDQDEAEGPEHSSER